MNFQAVAAESFARASKELSKSLAHTLGHFLKGRKPLLIAGGKIRKQNTSFNDTKMWCRLKTLFENILSYLTKTW